MTIALVYLLTDNTQKSSTLETTIHAETTQHTKVNTNKNLKPPNTISNTWLLVIKCWVLHIRFYTLYKNLPCFRAKAFIVPGFWEMAFVIIWPKTVSKLSIALPIFP